MIRYKPQAEAISKAITAVVCHRNTLDNIRLCVESFVHHYPDINLIVLDGCSTDYSQRWLLTRQALYPTLKVVSWSGINSHGIMMDHAIRNVVETPFVWFLDSDTMVLKRADIETIPMWLSEGTYAIGTEMVVSYNNDACGSPTNKEDEMQYIHPSCLFLNRERYLSYGYRPFTDHGAPCVYNFKDALARGEVMQGWKEGDECILHLCGGSWTTPRTVWTQDYGAMLRPLVTTVGFMFNHIDADAVGICPESEYMDIVMWEHLPRQSGKHFGNRFLVRGHYVTDVKVTEDMVDILANEIIEKGAQEKIGVFVRRDVWQREA